METLYLLCNVPTTKLAQMGWQSVQQTMKIGDMLIALKADRIHTPHCSSRQKRNALRV